MISNYSKFILTILLIMLLYFKNFNNDQKPTIISFLTRFCKNHFMKKNRPIVTSNANLGSFDGEFH